VVLCALRPGVVGRTRDMRATGGGLVGGPGESRNNEGGGSGRVGGLPRASLRWWGVGGAQRQGARRGELRPGCRWCGGRR